MHKRLGGSTAGTGDPDWPKRFPSIEYHPHYMNWGGVVQESQVTAWGWAGRAAEQCYYCASFVSLEIYSLSHVVFSFSLTIMVIIKFYFVSVIKLSLSQPTDFRFFSHFSFSSHCGAAGEGRGEGSDQETAWYSVATWS